MRVTDLAIPMSNSDRASGTDAAAAVTLAANANGRHALAVLWSYDGAPTSGNLTITDGGNTKVDIDIPSGYEVGSAGLFVAAPNSEVVVTLAAGGSGVTGKVTVLHTLK